MAKKKKTTNKKKTNVNTKKEILNNLSDTKTSNIIKCIVAVLIIFAIMYLITVLILKKSSADYITKNDEKTTIQYSEILAGTSFSKKESEYLVLFYDFKSDNASTYEGLYSDYKAKDEHLPIYYVDLSNTMNKSVVSENSNHEASNAEELRINGVTLIKFENNKISEYIEGEEDISNYLNN